MELRFFLLIFQLFCTVFCSFNECTFEEDECGWYSAGSIGVGSWKRVTTQELEDQNVDVHPSGDSMGEKTGEKKIFKKWKYEPGVTMNQYF